MTTEQKNFPAQPVLIVDDDKTSLFALVVTLRSAGITNLRTVSDSTGVPQVLANEAFSLMLLDLNMPGVSGHAVLQKTARLEGWPPIVIVTGSRPRDLAPGAWDGAVDCLVKPVDRDQLVRVVRTALARPRDEGNRRGKAAATEGAAKCLRA